MSTRPWMIVTGEYPPGCGGVGDYTAQLAAALAAAGDEVAVFRPPGSPDPVQVRGVEVVTLPDRFGAAARGVLSRRLDARPARVLVQYVPQAYGLRGANVAFCRWLRRRFGRGDDIRVMFHEPYFYLTLNPGYAVLAAFQRAMAAILLRSSGRVYVSTESWLPYLEPYAPRQFHPVVLPIPSNIPAVDEPSRVTAARAQVAGCAASRLVGHFGSYGDHIAPLLADAVVALLQQPSLAMLCIGDHSHSFVQRVVQQTPAFAGRVHATGRVTADSVSVYLQCCDAIVQPYPDGVTTRRTTVMAALANGRPVVTSDGDLTEPIWGRSGAVVLARAGDPAALAAAVRALLDNDAGRASLATRAGLAYAEHFAMGRTVDALRTGAEDAR